MNQRGFSVVELVVVVGIIGILLTITSLNFSSWLRKSQVERYVKELYVDIQDARTKAAFTKLRQGVVFASPQVQFRRFSSATDVGGTEVSTKTLPIAFTTNTWTTPTSDRIDFQTNGVMVDVVAPAKVICFTTTVDAAYDAIIVTSVLTSMGKQKNRGAACARTNVEPI